MGYLYTWMIPGYFNKNFISFLWIFEICILVIDSMEGFNIMDWFSCLLYLLFFHSLLNILIQKVNFVVSFKVGLFSFSWVVLSKDIPGILVPISFLGCSKTPNLSTLLSTSFFFFYFSLTLDLVLWIFKICFYCRSCFQIEDLIMTLWSFV